MEDMILISTRDRGFLLFIGTWSTGWERTSFPRALAKFEFEIIDWAVVITEKLGLWWAAGTDSVTAETALQVLDFGKAPSFMVLETEWSIPAIETVAVLGQGSRDCRVRSKRSSYKTGKKRPSTHNWKINTITIKSSVSRWLSPHPWEFCLTTWVLFFNVVSALQVIMTKFPIMETKFRETLIFKGHPKFIRNPW